MLAIKHVAEHLLLVLLLFPFCLAGAQAQTPTTDAIWVNDDADLTAIITEHRLLIFDGEKFEGAGLLRLEENIWKAKLKKKDKEFETTITVSGNALAFDIDGERYFFTHEATRNWNVEQRLNGRWRVDENPMAKVLIDNNTMIWAYDNNDTLYQMAFAIFGDYWLNLPDEDVPDPVALYHYTLNGDRLTMRQGEAQLFELIHLTDPNNVPGNGDTAASAKTVSLNTIDTPIKKLQAQETRILAELDQNNTKAKRTLLAWLRHDHAAVLFEDYKASKNETDLDAALAYADSATELSPDTARFWKTYGLINLASKRGMIADIEAEGAFRRVLEIAPNDGEARLFLIRFLLKDGEYKSAAEQYAILFASQPEIVIANDLHQMNLAFISADVAGWGLEVYDAYLKKIHLQDENLQIMMDMFEAPMDLNAYVLDEKVQVAKSILLKAEHRDEEAIRLLKTVSIPPSTPENIRKVADYLLDYWENEP
ncbi:MAG: hypothetical protein COB49_11825 [Alphaproteobacteria bacterium]|nr:MAG: hypothetical protein COB49_11825 [Alphaproteobacteria bacterium]